MTQATMPHAAHLPVNPAFESRNSMISTVPAVGFRKSRHNSDYTVYMTNNGALCLKLHIELSDQAI